MQKVINKKIILLLFSCCVLFALSGIGLSAKSVYAFNDVTFSSTEAIETEYTIYDEITIPKIQASQNKKNLPVDLIIQKNNNVLAVYENYKGGESYKFNACGEFLFIYSTIDTNGLICNSVYSTTVNNAIVLQNVSFPKYFEVGNEYSLGSPLIVYNDVNYDVSLSILTPSGSVFTDVKKVSIDEKGEYKFTYSAIVENNNVSFDYVVNAIETPSLLFSNGNGITSILSNKDLPSYSTPGNGVQVVANENNAIVKLNSEINLTKFTQEDTLISLQLLDTADVSPLRRLYVTLTDKYDSDNKVVIRLDKNATGAITDQWSYIMANYDGRYLAVGSSNGNRIIYSEQYGVVTTTSFTGSKWTNRPEFTIYFDYSERQIFVSTSKTSTALLLDLDDESMVGETRAWKGFTTGEAYLSVTMEGVNNFGGIIITEIANQKISGIDLIDDTNPVLYVENEDEYVDYLPDGIINTAYPLPKYSFWDLIDDNCQSSMTLYNIDGEPKVVEFDKVTSSFVPTTTGKFRVVYSVMDYSNNVTSKSFEFEIKTGLEEISVGFETVPEIAYVNSNYVIPKIKAQGGSGNLKATEKVYYNGNLITLNDNRIVRLDELGSIVIKYSIVDYIGQTYETDESELKIDVVATLSPIIKVYNVPKSVFKGTDLILPDYEIVDFNVNPTVYETKVTVNGVDVTATMKYSVTQNHGEILEIVYYVNSDDNVTESIFYVSVLKPKTIFDYLIMKDKDGNVLTSQQVEDNIETILQKECLEIIVKDDTIISMPNNIVDDGLVIKVKVSEIYNKYEYFDIELKDTFDSNNIIFFRISPNSKKDGCILKVNGQGQDVQIKGTFSNGENDNVYIYLYYSRLDKSLYNESGDKLTSILLNSLGLDFNGFVNGLVDLSIKIPKSYEQDDKSGINLYQISNQTFTTFFNKDGSPKDYNDIVAPVINYNFEMQNTTIVIGDTINISAASGHDVLCGDTVCTLSLKDPNGVIIWDNVDCSIDRTYLTTMCGYYIVTYSTKDKNNWQEERNVYILVKEENDPQIINTFKFKDKYAYLETINFVKPTIIEESDYQYYMLIKNPSGKIVVVKENGKYRFDEKGTNVIILYVQDAYYNYYKVEYRVIVE